MTSQSDMTMISAQKAIKWLFFWQLYTNMFLEKQIHGSRKISRVITRLMIVSLVKSMKSDIFGVPIKIQTWSRFLQEIIFSVDKPGPDIS